MPKTTSGLIYATGEGVPQDYPEAMKPGFLF